MAIPKLSDLRTWDGTQFTNDDIDYNSQTIVNWLSNGAADLVTNSITATNGFNAQNAKITNVLPATTGTDAVNYDQVQSLLNENNVFYPFTVASGKVSSTGYSNFIQKDSNTQVTVLAGNTNADLVVVQSDGTIETLTDNVVLEIGTDDDTYYIIKEKEETPIVTSGAVTIGLTFPSAPTNGDYFINISAVPFIGYLYASVGGWGEQSFALIGKVTVSSGTATVYPVQLNQNGYHINTYTKNKYDYANPIAKSNDITYTAETSGLLYNVVNNNTANSSLTLDGQVYYAAYYTALNVQNGFFIPISRGQTYLFTNSIERKFIPQIINIY
jgi:hypothetical protein